jgi:uncharacterized membrane protein
MPFCTQCGGQVQASDVFCAACGKTQSATAPPPPPPGAAPHVTSDPLRDMPARRASVLCYIPFVGWVFAIIVLASERFREDHIVRFHAFQGLYLFVLWLFVDWVFSPIANNARLPHNIGEVFQLAVIGAWVFMLIKTRVGEDFRLPLLGELAERSAAEQR